MYEAYPLQWPAGYKKTPPGDRIASQFKQTPDKAQQFLRKEIERLEALDLVISTNIPLKKNGFLYAEMMREKIDDPGVAVYFKNRGKDRSMCCDQYLTVWENIYALGKGIEALRGIDRWGISEFLDRAFTGFKALPESGPINQKSIWEILGLDEEPVSSLVVRVSYKMKAKKLHPDVAGGSHDAFAELTEAYKQALLKFNEKP